jgi:hypothetical protein
VLEPTKGVVVIVRAGRNVGLDANDGEATDVSGPATRLTSARRTSLGDAGGKRLELFTGEGVSPA